MKTLPEQIKDRFPKTPDWVYFLTRKIDDRLCYLFGHRWKFLSDIFGNFKGVRVCRRCFRYK